MFITKSRIKNGDLFRRSLCESSKPDFMQHNKRISYQAGILNETRHILTSDKLTSYYQKNLENIYDDAVANYKNADIKLWKNSNQLYQKFELKDYNHTNVINIFIGISNDLNEQYLTISNHLYDNEFEKNVLPLYKKIDNNGFNDTLYSIIINLNISDIQEKFRDYNIGTMYHEFTHIFQFKQKQFINDNCCNASYNADKILQLIHCNFSEIDNLDLMKELNQQDHFNIKDLIFVFACCIYYTDFSERNAHFQNIKAEIHKLVRDKFVRKDIVNNQNLRMRYFLNYSRTYAKYYFLRKIIYKILDDDLITLSNEQMLNKILKNINNEKIYNYFKKSFKILNKQFKNANTVINDEIENVIKEEKKLLNKK